MGQKYLKRWIQIGTSELYGSTLHPVTETALVVPTSPYAASKAAADMHLLAIHKTLGFPTNIIRPSNAYGPGQLLHRIIPRAVVCGLSGRKLPLHGGGMARKSYIHATDLARAIYSVATVAPLGAIYNAGPQSPVPIRYLVELVAHTIGISFDELCDVTPARFGEDSQYWLDSSAIGRLGWTPEISLQDGIRDMVRWGREHIGALMQAPQTYTFHA
jgi:dTDP-glucose 4,6-dehydratase